MRFGIAIINEVMILAIYALMGFACVKVLLKNNKGLSGKIKHPAASIIQLYIPKLYNRIL
jgi:hypothetical protein